MAGQPILIANWKMYKTVEETVQFIQEIVPQVAGSLVEILIAVPFTAIFSAAKAAKKSNIIIGAQNMNDATAGAFTGEIAAIMLKEAGAEFVLLGHSERRTLFQEDNEFVHKKVIRALKDDLRPVLCVGESALEREEGQTEKVLMEQLETCLKDISPEDCEKVMVAYEPLWAIGTGKTATPKIAQETHRWIREYLGKLWGKTKAAKIPILYGGSVKPENIQELLKQKDINGALVGGASLKVESFVSLVKNCQ